MQCREIIPTPASRCPSTMSPPWESTAPPHCSALPMFPALDQTLHSQWLLHVQAFTLTVRKCTALDNKWALWSIFQMQNNSKLQHTHSCMICLKKSYESFVLGGITRIPHWVFWYCSVYITIQKLDRISSSTSKIPNRDGIDLWGFFNAHGHEGLSGKGTGVCSDQLLCYLGKRVIDAESL